MSSGTGARPRRGYHHGDLRNALIDAAVRLVGAHGPEGLSLREAAREAGVTPSAVYRHFENREALLAAVAIEGHQRLHAAVRESLLHLGPGWRDSRAGAIEAFLVIGDSYVEFAVANPAHLRAMFSAGLDADALGAGVIPSGHEAYDVLVEVLDALVQTGTIEAPRRANAELAAWAAIHGLAALVADGPLRIPKAERLEASRYLSAVVLRGLGCAPELFPSALPAISVDPRAASRRRRRGGVNGSRASRSAPAGR